MSQHAYHPLLFCLVLENAHSSEQGRPINIAGRTPSIPVRSPQGMQHTTGVPGAGLIGVESCTNKITLHQRIMQWLIRKSNILIIYCYAALHDTQIHQAYRLASRLNKLTTIDVTKLRTKTFLQESIPHSAITRVVGPFAVRPGEHDHSSVQGAQPEMDRRNRGFIRASRTNCLFCRKRRPSCRYRSIKSPGY